MATTTADVLARTADIIEPYVTGTFKCRQRAEGAAETLAMYGLLTGGDAKTDLPVQEQVANILQCQFSWPEAETIAAELSACLLLKRA